MIKIKNEFNRILDEFRKDNKEDKFCKIILLLILLQPFFDILTSFSAESAAISVGVITKTLLLLIAACYLVFYKRDKLSIILIACIGIFYVLFMLFHFNKMIFMSETVNFIKTFYFPIITIFFINLFKKDNTKLLNILCFIISFSILIAVITGTSLLSYTSGSKLGFSGWFYSPNELSAMLAILFPLVVYTFLYKKNKFSVINLIITFIAILLIGTKAAYLGILLTFIVFLIAEIVLRYILKTKSKKGIICQLIILCVILACVTPFTPTYKNTVKHVGLATNTHIDKKGKKEFQIDIDNVVYYGREGYFKFVSTEYVKAPLEKKVFGLGKNVPNKDDETEYTVYQIERDMYDIYFCYGPIGTIIFFAVYIYLIVKYFKVIISKSFFENRKNIAYFTSILLGLAIAFMSGHVLMYPAASTYLALVICGFVMSANKFMIKEK